jgi:hypothetical protein
MTEEKTKENGKKIKDKAVCIAEQYYRKKGYEFFEQQGKKKAIGGCDDGKTMGRGYDLLIKKGDECCTVEVKGATPPDGIPDAYETEFDLSDEDKPMFKADHLFLVKFKEDGEAEYAHDIPKMVINREKYTRGDKRHKIKTTVVFSRNIKNDLKDGNLDDFKIERGEWGDTE